MDQLFDVIVLLHFDGDLQLKLGHRQLAERRHRQALEWDERYWRGFQVRARSTACRWISRRLAMRSPPAAI